MEYYNRDTYDEFDQNNNNKDNRKADNRTITVRQRVNEVDDKLDDEKSKLQKLSKMQESVEAIAKNMDKCIELLSKSMKGPTTDNMFNDMYNSNKAFYTKASINIENEEMATRKNINELYKEKDKILSENRQEEAEENKEEHFE